MERMFKEAVSMGLRALAGAVLCTGILGGVSAYAENTLRAGPQANAATQAAVAVKPHYLFVQTAPSAMVTDHLLTLRHVRPRSIWFTDRPVRGFGVIDTVGFVQNWIDNNASNSFKKDPPNAVLVDGGSRKPNQAPLGMTLRSPAWDKEGNLVYSVSYLPGSKTPDRPVELKEVSLFVDDVTNIGSAKGNGNVIEIIGSNVAEFSPSVSFYAS